MTADAAIAQVGHALRVAAAQDADAGWKADYERRCAANRVALALAVRYLLDDAADVASRDRARAALAEYDAIARTLQERMEGKR